MQLYEGETAAARFEAIEPSSLAAKIRALSTQPVTVIGIDGRSGGGKTTLARVLAAQLDATLLSTDDFAWWHSLFDWPDMIIENALEPLRAGFNIDYRPDAWVERGREGAIKVAASKFVIVEGVGATQLKMRNQTDLRIWVQSDAVEARTRGLIRDAAERPDPAEALAFWNEWQAAEDLFQAEQQSWLGADFVVCGTPTAKLTGSVQLLESQILISV